MTNAMNSATTRATRADLASLIKAVQPLLPELTASEQRVASTLYQLLARGRPVSRKELANVVDRPLGEIESLLNRWWGVQYTSSGQIDGFWGLTLQETAHCLRVNETLLYTWCAWDTLFIPSVLNQVTHVESLCQATKVPIRLTVASHGVLHRQPLDTVVSFLIPNARRVREDVIGSFCHAVHFFCSPDVTNAWLVAHPEVFVLSLDDAYALGRSLSIVQYLGE